MSLTHIQAEISLASFASAAKQGGGGSASIKGTNRHQQGEGVHSMTANYLSSGAGTHSGGGRMRGGGGEEQCRWHHRKPPLPHASP